MRDFITLNREANAIRLRRSAFSGTFLLVEGSSDKAFYQRFVDRNECELVTTSGKLSSKQRAIKILELLEKSNFSGILAIVDADFDRLTTLSTNPNLLFTDTHDLETTIIKSMALDKVVAEFGSEDKITKFEKSKKVRESLIEGGVIIGYLRWVSQIENLDLTFGTMEFNKFIDDKTLQINQTNLIREVQNKSQAFNIRNEEIEKLLENKYSCELDLWQIGCGHDLVKILSIALRKTIGSNTSKAVDSEVLERSLRLAYEEIYFSKTKLYQNIVGWEKCNQPFKVLPHKA